MFDLSQIYNSLRFTFNCVRIPMFGHKTRSNWDFNYGAEAEARRREWGAVKSGQPWLTFSPQYFKPINTGAQ